MGFTTASADFLVETPIRATLGIGGKIFMVSAAAGGNYNELIRQWLPDFDGELRFFTTITLANTAMAANRGDVCFIAPGYTETIAAAAGTTMTKAGSTWIGLGTGSDRPTITFATSTAASLDISGNGVKTRNIVGLAGIDGLTKPINVTGNFCDIQFEWQDASSAVEAETVVRLDTADNCKLDLVYKGFTAGNAAVRVVAVDDCDNVTISIDAYGVVSTAWVNFVDVASTNVMVTGTTYTQGISTGARNVVDTVTGSTWYMTIIDKSAGATYTGGSAAAIASDDVSAITAALLVPTADVSTNTNERDVIGNKTDASVTTVGTTKSITAYLKGVLGVTVLANGTFTTSSTTVPADTSRTEASLYWDGCYLIPLTGAAAFQPRCISSFNNTGGVFTLDVSTPFTSAPGTVAYVIVGSKQPVVVAADSTANTMPYHVTGNKTDASVYAPSTTKSIAAYAKGSADLQMKVVKKAAATMVNGQTLFTIAGGPIMVHGLVSICETANDATASTLQYNALPTSGSPVTISNASASIANAAAGASITLAGTALATAALYNSGGPNLIANPGTILVPAGSITAVVGVGSTTGTWAHYLRYSPMATGVTVT